MPTWTKHQQAVIDHKDNNLLVSAAAGSGKTAVMVEHIFKTVIENNTSIDRMIVATYTNAAATSMKEKLRRKFDDAFAKNPENDFLLKQKQLIDRANISTIHSFCINILRKYYFRTPLPPDFRIIEKAQENALSDAALKEILEEAAKLYNNGLFPQYKDVLIQFADSKNDDTVATAIFELNKKTKDLLHPQDFKKHILDIYSDKEGTVYKKYLAEHVNFLLECAIDHSEKIISDFKGTDVEIKAIKRANTYIEVLDKAIHEPNLELKCNILTDEYKTESCSTKLTSYPILKTNSLAIKALRDKAIELLKDIETYDLTSLKPAIEGLFILHDKYVERFDELMLKEGGATFAAILRHMVNLLENNPDICEDLKNSIDYIYIDEYQDTNAFQEFIITSISKGNNMFFVGDIKQSIYSFQNARPELFKEKMDTYSKDSGGVKLNLVNNFRSYPQILDGVNFIFKNVMNDKDISEIIYDEDSFLYPSPDETFQQYSDCLYLDGERQPANEVLVVEGSKDQEAYAVALKIKELLKTSIYEDGVLRPIRYSDIAILGRTNDMGLRFIPAFDAMNIPFSIQPKEAEDLTDTTANIISLLRLLTLRRNDIDLVTVLLSPIGGFTPTELGKIRAENPSGNFYDSLKNYSENKKIKNKIDDFFKMLDELEIIEKSMSLSDFIEYIANETGYIYYTAYLPKNSKEQEALDRLISTARTYSSFSDKGILGFIDYYKNICEPRENGFSADKNDNKVHYMTIHHSKGLEFPIVIVIGCSETGKFSDGKYHFDEKYGFAFNYNSLDDYGIRTNHESIATRIIKSVKKSQEQAEHMRVFYVALTRARNKLILSFNDKKERICQRASIPSKCVLADYSTYADLFLPLLAYHKDGQPLRDYISDGKFNFDTVKYTDSDWVVEIYDNLVLPDTKEEVPDEYTLNEEEYLKVVEDNFNWKYAYTSATTQRTKHSPSKKDIRIKIPLRKPAFEDKEYKGAQKGTVVHFFMEHVSFTSKKTAKEQADDMLKSGILSEEEYNALPFYQLEAFMSSEFKKRMEASDLICRERSFCHIIPFNDDGDETLVQGIIDCYFFEGDDIILLDYKTDYINGDLDEHILHHTPQLKMYKSALEELYPGKNVYPYIHFFHVNKTIEIK